MDELDRQIVALLVEDGRASFRWLGDRVGLSAPAVKRRVDRLLADGVVERIAAQLAPSALGWRTTAFVELFCDGRVPPAGLRDALSPIPEVVAAYTVTGDADALVQIVVADTDHLERTLERIRGAGFVTKTRSTVVLSRLVERGGPPAVGPVTGITDGRHGPGPVS